MLLNKKMWTYLIILIIILFFLYVIQTWIEPYVDNKSAGTFTYLVNQSFKNLEK